MSFKTTTVSSSPRARRCYQKWQEMEHEQVLFCTDKKNRTESHYSRTQYRAWALPWAAPACGTTLPKKKPSMMCCAFRAE
jgi:hypothetical protein